VDQTIATLRCAFAHEQNTQDVKLMRRIISILEKYRQVLEHVEQADSGHVGKSGHHAEPSPEVPLGAVGYGSTPDEPAGEPVTVAHAA
jgi:hypothetical protein